jgi:hypothetical protein
MGTGALLCPGAYTTVETAGTAYPIGTYEFTQVFSWVRSLVFY